jgi:hypothetical protein
MQWFGVRVFMQFFYVDHFDNVSIVAGVVKIKI